MFERMLRNARITGQDRPVDIGISDGRIAAIAVDGSLRAAEAGAIEELGGRFLSSGLVETHIHLDKACILDRCTLCHGTLEEAVRETAAAKAGFTEEDVYRRGRQVLEKAVSHGTTHLRSFVEIDPRAGFRSFEALLRLKADYAHVVDLEICAFAQEGLTQEPQTLAMLERACERGADLVGGCPYTDPDPARHIEQIFDLARRFDMAVDVHLDFDLAPERSNLHHVLRETRARAWGGRVSIGHVTQLSAVPPAQRDATARRLADAGIALTVLPATDVFLLGRDADRLVPRGLVPAHGLARHGVVASLASNNVLNPFTPFGDASLVRMANFYANVAQAAQEDELREVFGMISSSAARLVGVEHGMVVGAPADLVLFDAADAVSVVREIAPALRGWKRGRPTFRRAPPELLFRPGGWADQPGCGV